MAKPIRISIAQPCHEGWDEMTPTQQGAFCSSCQKTVIDFTGKTENEIYEIVSRQNGGACGRFNAYQIEGAIHKIELNNSFFNWKAIAASLAAIISADRISAGTGDTGKYPVVCSSPRIMKDTVTALPISEKKPEQDTSAVTLRGRVVDSRTLKPIENASIYFGACSERQLTDSSGNFTMEIPKHLLKDKTQILNIRGWDHERRSVPLSDFDLKKPLLIKLKYSREIVMGLYM